QKELIRQSRVLATRTLVDAIAGAEPRPRVLVNASAVGYYGPRDDEPLDESAGPGAGFLADVCRAWEQEALRAEDLGLRVVRLGRTLARPVWLPTPAFALRLALGEMAELLLSGQRVLPGIAERLAYQWRYPELSGALRASVRR